MAPPFFISATDGHEKKVKSKVPYIALFPNRVTTSRKRIQERYTARRMG
jgi:hypothetical protein